MICYHHNDLDGRCAAAIVLRKYPKCRMREINYNEDDPDFKKEINSPMTRVFIVDFSFKPEKMKELINLVGYPRITWIDHHKTAKDYKYFTRDGCEVSLPGLCDFSGELSGCELTWQYLFPDKPMPEAVRLLGDYDTWRFDTKGRTMAFQFGMRSLGNMPDNGVWVGLLDASEHREIVIISKGEAVVNYKTNVSRRILNNGYNLEWEGHMCFIVNTPMIDSAMFDLHACASEYGLLVSWILIGKTYNVSLRSRGGVDVSVIAKKYGGGGHKGSAGFVCESLPWEK